MPDRTKRDAESDRREFLAKAGKFASVTSPLVTTLLSTSLTSKAIAASGGGIRRSDSGAARAKYGVD
jgi:hypothetical protein